MVDNINKTYVRLKRAEYDVVYPYLLNNKSQLSNLTESEFTLKVAKALDMPHLTIGALRSTRQKLKIPVKAARKKIIDPSQQSLRLSSDEMFLAKIENKLDKIEQMLKQYLKLDL